MDDPNIENAKSPRTKQSPAVEAIKIGITLLVIVLLLGIIQYPSWWLRMLHEGPRAILNEALGEFFRLNLLVFFSCVVISLACYYLFSLRAIWALLLSYELRIIFGSRFLSGFMPAVFALAVFRLYATNLEHSRFQTQQEILGKLDQIAQEPSKSGKPYSVDLPKGPLDYIYQDVKKIDDLFKQIEPSEKLEERSVEQKLTGKDEGSAGIEKLAKFSSGNEHTVQSKENYRPTELSPAGKLQLIYKSLAAQGTLWEVRQIEIQNKDLSDFDSSVELLKEKYKIPLLSEKLHELRLQLLAKAVELKNDNGVPMEGFVFVKGDFATVVSTNSVQLKYQLVASMPERAVLIASFPSTGLVDSELDRFGSEDNWRLTVFGKVIHKTESTNSVVWRVQPYAIFR